MLTLGRAGLADLPVPWEASLSALHAEIDCEKDGVRIRRSDGASNPVYLRGNITDCDGVAPGEQFVIGKTRFLLVRIDAEESSNI